MKLTLFLICMSVTASYSNAASMNITLNCEDSKPHEFRAAGYLVGNPKADLQGAAKKADESTARKIFQIVNPASDQENTYHKAFDFGKFRFVRNKEASRGWDVYERTDGIKVWMKMSPTPERVRIFEDQNLWVKTYAKDQLLVLRMSGDDKEAKDFYIHTQTTKITIKGKRRAANYLFDHCTRDNPPANPKSFPKIEPAKT